MGRSLSSPVYGDISSSVVPVALGGSGARSRDDAVVNLNLIPKEIVGQAFGVLQLDAQGKALASAFAFNIPGKPAVAGVGELVTSQSSMYTITNFDSENDYSVTVIGGLGSVSLTDDTITYTAPAVGGDFGFMVNEKMCPVVVAPPHVLAPEITSPVNLATNQTPTLTLSTTNFLTFGASDTHSSSSWQIATDIGFAVIVYQSLLDATNKVTLPASGLTGGTVYYARVKHVGSTLGSSEWSDVITFTTAAIDAPTVTAPANGATGFGPTVSMTSSAFVSSQLADTHASSDWQIANDAAFTSIHASVTSDSTNKTSWTNSVALLSNKTYYLRTRHKGALLGASAWSPTVSFSTLAGFQANTPAITSPANGATGVAASIAFASSAFSVNGGSDTHVSSDWQLSTNAGFTAIVNSVNASTTNKTSWTVTGLTSNMTYYVRTRQTGSTFTTSEWSTPVSFTTSVFSVNQPTITAPTNGAVNTALTIAATASAFGVSSGSDTHASSSWEVATDPAFTAIVKSSYNDTVNKTSWSITGLTGNTTYYFRVKYNGTALGSSAWSAAVSFTTSKVARPSITSPANGATGQSSSVTLTTSAFATSGVSDTHTASTWWIATDIDFTNIVKTTVNDSVNKTSWTATDLASNTTYYASMAHIGAALGASENAPVISFTTAVFSVNTPSITSPANGATGRPSTVAITSSAFATTGSTDTHASSSWELSTNSAFTNIVRSSYNNTTSKTSWSVTGLSGSTTYYLRVRYNGTALGASAWSTIIQFTTTAMYVNRPSIIAVENAGTRITCTTSAFSVYGGADTHASSTWYVKRGSTAVTNATSTTKKITATLNFGNNSDYSTSIYNIYVTHNGATLGASALSTTVVQTQQGNVSTSAQLLS